MRNLSPRFFSHLLTLTEQASRGRKREGEDLDLGDEDMERETAMQNRMKLGKIALGKVVPGVKVRK